MGFLELTKQRFIKAGISSASDDAILIEARRRGGKDKDPLTGKLATNALSLSRKGLKEWKAAVTAATDPENPDFTMLEDLLNQLLLDGHLMSCIDSRILKVEQSPFKLVGADGNTNEEATIMLQNEWLTNWMRYALMTKFTGATVLELWELDEEGDLNTVSKIPKQHINFLKKLILKNPGDVTGWQYVESEYETYYMQIGRNEDLGMVTDIAPIILAKKLAIGSWLDFIEKFGVPPRWVTTDREDDTRLNELFEMMQAMISNHFAVLRGKEKIEIAQTPNTDAHNVFNEMIERMNSEISKRVLGATGTSDEKSYVGAALVHQDVANDRHESDKRFIKNLINNELIPKLALLSPRYAGLTGLSFQWDDAKEMSATEIIESVAKLGTQFEFDVEKLAELTGLPIVAAKELTPSPGGASEKK
jgi:hypothetical protein